MWERINSRRLCVVVLFSMILSTQVAQAQEVIEDISLIFYGCMQGDEIHAHPDFRAIQTVEAMRATAHSMSDSSPLCPSTSPDEERIFEGYYRPIDTGTLLAVHSDDGVNVYIDGEQVLANYETPQHLPDVHPYPSGGPDSFHLIAPAGGWTANTWYHLRIEYKNTQYDGLGDLDGVNLFAFVGDAQIEEGLKVEGVLVEDPASYKVLSTRFGLLNVGGVKADNAAAKVTLKLVTNVFDDDIIELITWQNPGIQDQNNPRKGTVPIGTSALQTVRIFWDGHYCKTIKVWPIYATKTAFLHRAEDLWPVECDEECMWDHFVNIGEGTFGPHWWHNISGYCGNQGIVEFTVTPEGVGNFPCVKFDVTQQIERKGSKLDPDRMVWLVQSKYWPGRDGFTQDGPTEAERDNANDEGLGNNDNIPNMNDRIYSIDCPGFYNPLEKSEGVYYPKIRYRANFLTFVRVSLDFQSPSGPGERGMRCSDNFLWHSRKYGVLTPGGIGPVAQEGGGQSIAVQDLGQGYAWKKMVVHIITGGQGCGTYRVSEDGGKTFGEPQAFGQDPEPFGQFDLHGARVTFPPGEYHGTDLFSFIIRPAHYEAGGEAGDNEIAADYVSPE